MNSIHICYECAMGRHESCRGVCMWCMVECGCKIYHAEQFNSILGKLKTEQQYDPAEITVVENNSQEGVLSGDDPKKWSADYQFTGNLIIVPVHGFFGGLIEGKIKDRLQQALAG